MRSNICAVTSCDKSALINDVVECHGSLGSSSIGDNTDRRTRGTRAETGSVGVGDVAVERDTERYLCGGEICLCPLLYTASDIGFGLGRIGTSVVQRCVCARSRGSWTMKLA
jgi:hypothetical protein